MKNILLLTDFSENSETAIHYALQLHQGESCNFILLHVQKASNYTSDDLMVSQATTSVHTSILGETKKKLENIRHGLEKQYTSKKFSFEVLVDYDSFTDAIEQAVKMKKIALIVMGTNGATNAKEVLFGSNTVKVIRSVSCTVLAIPQHTTFTKPRTVLYALDYFENFDSLSTNPLLDLLEKFKSTLKILKIKEDETVTEAEKNDIIAMKEKFSNVRHTFHTMINIPTALAIESFVQIMNIDITAVVLHDESLLERFFKGSETSKISYGSKIPLLVLKRGKV
ncbi:universal stress protein [Aquimarina intermedia]|uniref:Nucleotide-binding universal stress UspA family protein n=1 Tax=Aquimarina intermedia TaxID=350814 RepID=A0A5S5C7D5_9FLAO|nr:universal stress protein [Aquimarina intermedia]TYP74240.1 nucleotide-binding universal stress UspA family protein [Aquimarina intermedia]